MAPHITAQALKTAIFCAKVMELMGYEVSPKRKETRYDIIRRLRSARRSSRCAGSAREFRRAPVSSFVTPEPWAMPGYVDPVIMAAGAFVQGASIELSADAPMRGTRMCAIYRAA